MNKITSAILAGLLLTAGCSKEVTTTVEKTVPTAVDAAKPTDAAVVATPPVVSPPVEQVGPVAPAQVTQTSVEQTPAVKLTPAQQREYDRLIKDTKRLARKAEKLVDEASRNPAQQSK